MPAAIIGLALGGLALGRGGLALGELAVEHVGRSAGYFRYGTVGLLWCRIEALGGLTPKGLTRGIRGLEAGELALVWECL